LCSDSVLKHCAANRNRWLSAFPNVGPYTVCIYIYIYIHYVKISGFTRSSVYIYDISRLRAKHRDNVDIPQTYLNLRKASLAIKLWRRSHRKFRSKQRISLALDNRGTVPLCQFPPPSIHARNITVALSAVGRFAE
jgi:hypothetical protein